MNSNRPVVLRAAQDEAGVSDVDLDDGGVLFYGDVEQAEDEAGQLLASFSSSLRSLFV